MASAEQIARTRFLINDTDSNNYAFTEPEIEDSIDTQGSALRAAYSLTQIIATSVDKMKIILQADPEGYSTEGFARIFQNRLDDLKQQILANDTPHSIYQEDDDRWTWSADDYLDEMTSPLD